MTEKPRPLSAEEKTQARDVLGCSRIAYLSVTDGGPTWSRISFASQLPDGIATQWGRIYLPHRRRTEEPSARGRSPRLSGRHRRCRVRPRRRAPARTRSLSLGPGRGPAVRLEEPQPARGGAASDRGQVRPGASHLPFAEEDFRRPWSTRSRSRSSATSSGGGVSNFPEPLRYLAPTSCNAGRAPSTTSAPRSRPCGSSRAQPNPPPGTTSTRCSCISRQKATSSSMGDFGNM